MGEKIKDLSEFRVENLRVAVEYNKGWSKGAIDIHIQSKKFRYVCNDKELMELFSLAVSAKRKFDSIKSISISKIEENL